MSVWFVYRCPYLGPTEKHVKRFPDATLLDWFRRIWRPIPYDKEAWAYAEELLGCEVYSFGSMFVSIAESGRQPPETMEDAVGAVSAMYTNEILHGPHVVQVLTDDDELDMAWFLLDDQFLAEHPGLATFLLTEDWKLPAEIGPGGFTTNEPTEIVRPAGSGPGTTWVVWLSSDPDHLEHPGVVMAIEGLRLPQLSRYLIRTGKRDISGDTSCVLERIREQLRFELEGAGPQEESFLAALSANPGDEATWSAYGDFREEQGRRSPDLDLLERALPRMNRTDKNKLLRVEEHIAQYLVDDEGESEQWYLFDDLWASAHPVLVNGLFRYAARWDVLTVEPVDGEEAEADDRE